MFVISALIFVCVVDSSAAVADEELGMCGLHPHLRLAWRKPKSFRPIKVFVFFLAPLLAFNYLGSIRDEGEMAFFHEIVFYVFLVLWHIAVVLWGTVKFGLLPRKWTSSSSSSWSPSASSPKPSFAVWPKFSSLADQAILHQHLSGFHSSAAQKDAHDDSGVVLRNVIHKSDISKQVTVGQNQAVLRHVIIHFPTSSEVSE